MIESKDISIIIQGPVYEDIAKKIIYNMRTLLPDAEIIISTWIGQKVVGLNADLIILNEDPGCVEILENPIRYSTANRQIVSTLAGLKKGTRKYAIKMRSDIYFKNTGFLKYFDKFNERNDEYKILINRVVMSTIFTPNPKRYALPYHPSDWFYFGLRDDLINIFDIPLSIEPETSRWYENHIYPELNTEPYLCRYRAEQYIWYTFLKKYINFKFEHAFDVYNGNIERSELVFANNSVLVDPNRLGLRSYKYQNITKEQLNTYFSPLYNYYEWLKLYKQYCAPDFKLPLIDFRILIRTAKWIFSEFKINRKQTIYRVISSIKFRLRK